MKKTIIVFLVLGFVVGIVFLLSKGSQESISTISQNVERLDVGATKNRYRDPSGFSFEKLSGYEIRTIADDMGKTLLFEKEGVTGSGFQIFISYYDEPALEFTAARIRKDLPDLVMKEVKEFEIADGRGVMFDSDSGREIWFVVGESLYQVTAPLSEAEPAEHVVTTFTID